MNARPTERGKRATNREPRVLVRIPYRRCQWKCGMAYMPPLQTPGTAYTSREPSNASNTHGPHTCGPYEPTGNNRQTGKANIFRRLARLRTRAGFQNGSPDEPYRQERKGIVTESLCLVRNGNRLGRPHQTSGVSKGARASELAAAFSVFCRRQNQRRALVPQWRPRNRGHESGQKPYCRR